MVVVITGASAGVGRATVRAFARTGAAIGLLARGIDGLSAARREIESQGCRAVAIPTDAIDNVIYDFRGIDRAGHPVVEFWDLLAPITPWNNWPPEDVAREWAEALEFRPIHRTAASSKNTGNGAHAHSPSSGGKGVNCPRSFRPPSKPTV